MRHKSYKQNVGKKVKFDPVPMVDNGYGWEPWEANPDWTIVSVSGTKNQEIVFYCDAYGYQITLGGDQTRGFTTDPHRRRGGKQEYGTQKLGVQLYVDSPNIHITPLLSEQRLKEQREFVRQQKALSQKSIARAGRRIAKPAQSSAFWTGVLVGGLTLWAVT